MGNNRQQKQEQLSTGRDDEFSNLGKDLGLNKNKEEYQQQEQEQEQDLAQEQLQEQEQQQEQNQEREQLDPVNQKHEAQRLSLTAQRNIVHWHKFWRRAEHINSDLNQALAQPGDEPSSLLARLLGDLAPSA